MRTITRRHRLTTAAVAVLGLVGAATAVATADPVLAPPTGLQAVGPVSSEHGYPVWYEDSGVFDPSTGAKIRDPLRLTQCIDTGDPMCDPALLMSEMPDGSKPVSFPDNWPGETFYFAGDAGIDLPSGGKAIFVSALEATFANEVARPGDQVVFGRIRFDIDFPGAGTYTVTHPYGKDVLQVSADEADSFRYVEDVTPAPSNFTLAMKSRINPFLTWDGGLVQKNGNWYVGDPAVEHKVTGSALGTNFFRIEGPNIGGPGINSIETDLFTLMGKVSTNSDVEPVAAKYTETADGKGFLDVFANSDPGDTITVAADGIATTTLQGNGRRYFGRIALTGPPPSTVTITNASDIPAAVHKGVPVTDNVMVTGATYNADDDTLTVSATSTDQLEPTPTLNIKGLAEALDGTATLNDGTVTVTGVQAPPASVTVESSAGGSDTAPITISGSGSVQADPVTAVAVGPSEVPSGAAVELDGSSSRNATSYKWSQTGGPTVTLNGSDTARAGFTAPAGPTQLTFTLETTGADGSKATSEPLTVTVADAAVPPTAVATASMSSAQVGQMVTVSAADSTNASTFAWTQQQNGAAVVNFDAAAKSFSFAMPSTTEPLVFDLTVSSPGGGTATSSVTVSPIGDELAVTSAQFRSDKREWRIQGTASLSSSNSVTVYLENADGSKGPEVGTAVVNAPVAPATVGDWSVRVRNGGAPGAGQDSLIVESTKGGHLDGVGFTSRR